MKVVIGLGNPGRKYDRDRHNVGFMVLDLIASRWKVRLDRREHEAHIGKATFSGERILLVKPQSYMNDSGGPAVGVARRYGLTPQMFVAVYDDMDLPLGCVRVRAAGGAGGHRGMRSLIAHLGGSCLPRVRVGIGRPPAGLDPVDYVLEKFAPAERDTAGEAIRRAADAVECVIVDGPQCAMNRFNAMTSTQKGD